MLRATATVGAAVALALGTVGSSEGAPASTKAIVATADEPIAAIAMDGPLVAYDVYGAQKDDGTHVCNRLVALNVLTGQGGTVSGNRSCYVDDSSTGGGVEQIAVAGSRILWRSVEGGNTEADDTLFESSFPNPKERVVASALRSGDPPGNGNWIAGLVGDGPLLAASTYKTSPTGKLVSARLRQVDATRLGTSIVTGKDSVVSAGADRGRIVVLTRGHQAVMYSSTGKILRRWAAGAAREAAVHKDYVLLLQPGKLVIENAVTGKHVKDMTVPRFAKSLDLDSGIAVYVSGKTVHAILLSRGRDVVVASASTKMAGAAIEAPGLAYAWSIYVPGTNGAPGKPVGNIGFMPLAELRARLG